jgi:predicted dehydrogenase/threonine dehydrogenase-like Zn-dependent dehydrogenase
MKQVLIQKGEILLENVPKPSIDKNEILVKNSYSCISIGTELNGIKSTSIPLWKKALNNPDKVKEVFKLALNTGLSKTFNIVEGIKDTKYPTGYSTSGIVVEVGAQIKDIMPGDRVACAGAQSAFHAEYISVSRNLCVKIPENVSLDEASTVTLGSIALQGVRRAEPTLGEIFVVIGLGILGQITAQILKANGCKVIGIDIHNTKIKLAKSLGIDYCLDPEDLNDKINIQRLTNGIGADGVIITAASNSNEIMSKAFHFCRKKGRVVLVGDVGLNLNRGDFYVKEIDFRISTSYGPGRYDPLYEVKGIDYPIAYVRWTENRNMLEYLNLISTKKVIINKLISNYFELDEASNAYNFLKNNSQSTTIALFKYDVEVNSNSTLQIVHSKELKKDIINIALVGAGNFANSVHLPNLKKLKNYFNIHTISSKSGLSAKLSADKFNAQFCTTSFEDILSNDEIDAVIICTRHNLHSEMALKALKAGKHVLLEKPTALNLNQLSQIDKFFKSNTNDLKPLLLTGYNRRFSPHILKIKKIINNRTSPLIINYQMNAGYIPLDHWVHSEEGGGRNIGEACHIYDLFTFLTNSKIKKVNTNFMDSQTKYYSKFDNFITTITFKDGSIGNLIYSANGNKSVSKEKLTICVDGKHLELDDYKLLNIYDKTSTIFKTKYQEKGQTEELIEFANAIKTGIWPIPWWQQYQVAEVSFLIDDKITQEA